MKSVKISCILLFCLTILLGIIYPYFMWGIGQLFFHRQANGMMIYRNKKAVGSQWIAQSFTDAKYFHPRPSNAGERGYDAAHSSASNLGPTSQKLIDLLKQRIADYRSKNQISGEIPADAVTASGSGLDPHISVANAHLQARRVATARNLPLEEVKRLIDEWTEEPDWWIFGEARINVLQINLALDDLAKIESAQ